MSTTLVVYPLLDGWDPCGEQILGTRIDLGSDAGARVDFRILVDDIPKQPLPAHITSVIDDGNHEFPLNPRDLLWTTAGAIADIDKTHVRELGTDVKAALAYIRALPADTRVVLEFR